jgi:hypothetical protein
LAKRIKDAETEAGDIAYQNSGVHLFRTGQLASSTLFSLGHGANDALKTIRFTH